MKIDWTDVRRLGELTILTRASYLSLIIVPFIAYFYTTENKIASFVSPIKLEAQAKSLEDFANKNGMRQCTKCLSQIRRKIKEIGKDDPNKLGIDWVRAFAAALIIAIAHLLYQMLCPKIIQAFDEDEYKQNQKANYLHSGSPIDFADTKRELKEMMDKPLESRPISGKSLLNSLSATEDRKIAAKLREMPQSQMWEVKVFLDLLKLDGELSPKRKKIASAIDTITKNVNEDDKKILELSTIDTYAKMKYEEEKGKIPMGAKINIFLYALGIAILLVIVISQFTKVLNSAGLQVINDDGTINFQSFVDFWFYLPGM